jgi:plasmid segregation protein ParM
MKILGVDNGYNFTKTSKGVCIHSTIKQGIDDINDVIQVSVGENDYIVGEVNGKYITDADKLKNRNTKELLKVTTLTAIGLSYPKESYIELNLVVGLPIGYFSNQKDEMKYMMENLSEKIYINEVGIEQTIKVNEVLVYPQSTGLVFKKANELKLESSLIIDIGGGTWDISQFNGLKLEKKATYQEGMLVLYEKIAQFLNSNYYTNYEPSEIYKLLNRGFFTAAGEKKSMDVVKNIVVDHVNSIMTKITRSFDVISVDNIFLIGGGAKELSLYIKEHLPNAELIDNSQFTNAECFEIMGKMKLIK